MQNKYEEADLLGRNIVMKIFPKIDMVETDISARCDLSGTSLTGNWYMEVKYRGDLKSTSYDTDILEYEKLSALRNIDRNGTYFYFMIFSDGVARCYNLKDINIMDVYINNDLYPVSSSENKGHKEKLMIELPVNKAKVYKWN